MSKSLAERVKFTITTSAPYANEHDELGSPRANLTWFAPDRQFPFGVCLHWFRVSREYGSIGDLIECNWKHFPDLYAHIRTTDPRDFVYSDPYVTRDGL